MVSAINRIEVVKVVAYFYVHVVYCTILYIHFRIEGGLRSILLHIAQQDENLVHHSQGL